MTPRPKADHASLKALHAHDGTRHSVFTVTLTYTEAHLMNRVREQLSEECGKLNIDCPNYRLLAHRIEALDVLCDQLGLEEGKHRLRLTGIAYPWSEGDIRRILGPAPETSLEKHMRRARAAEKDEAA